MTAPRAVVAPAGFSLDPTPWIELYLGDGDEPDPEGLGFFHVTTRVTLVRQAGALRSRAQLREMKIVGLGGGWQNEEPGKVSFVYERYRAEWLERAIRVAVRAARNEMSAADVVRAVLEWTDFPHDNAWNADLFDLWDEGDEAARAPYEKKMQGVVALLYEHDLEPTELPGSAMDLEGLIRDNASELEEMYQTGREKYELIIGLETAISEFSQLSHGDIQGCPPVVGFTAPYAVFSTIEPGEIAIVQAAVREGARSEYVALECELRFSPDDVAIVGIGLGGGRRQNPGGAMPPGFDSFSGEDLFGEDEAGAGGGAGGGERCRILETLKRGDTVVVGKTSWTVESTHGATVYVVRAGTRGRKLYHLRVEAVEPCTVAVDEVFPGSGDSKGLPPAARGVVRLA